MISRRHFLQLAAGIGGLLPAGCSSWKPGPQHRLANAKVLIVGAGFGGLNVARTLRLLAPELKITLIDRNATYRRCLGSNEVIAGFKPESNLHHPLIGNASLRGIDMVIGEVQSLDTHHRLARLKDGSQIAYDRLLLSPGITLRMDAIEGYNPQTVDAVPHAWSGGPQALNLRRQLEAMPAGGVFVMTVPENPYRCPPGPYERASLVAARFKQVNPRAKILILDDKSKFPKQKAFMAAWNQLYPGMIEWISMEHEGRIDHIDCNARTVVTEFGRHKADVLNVIPPQRAGGIAISAGLANETGWCPINPVTFESTLMPDVHVIGDSCQLTPLPKSAFAAQAQARACALAMVELLQERLPSPARLINHCYSLTAPDQAISVSGVYRIMGPPDQIEAIVTAESQPGDNAYLEARYARDWYDLILGETFGSAP